MKKIRQIEITEELQNYIFDVSLRESKILQKLRTEIFAPKSDMMQNSPDITQFICLLAKLIKARKIIEVGVYKGYTTLALAEILPKDGKIIACDINKQWTDLAKNYWSLAEVENKIELKLAPAEETLNSLILAGLINSFDLIYIDADKPSYITYYELSLQLLRKDGLIVVDNTLWYGNVINHDITDRDTQAIREFNIKIKEDFRVNISLLPIRDGITLLQKK